MDLGISRRIWGLILSKAARHFPHLFTPWEEEMGIAGDRDAERYAKTYSTAVWAYACVRAIAETSASVPLKFYKQSQKEKEEILDGEIVSLFKHVNPFMTCADLIEATSGHLQLNGNAYWAFDAGDIYLLRPDRVKILPDPQNFIRGYLYKPSFTDKHIRYEADEVVHFKLFNPDHDYYGLSPLAVARRSLTMQFHADTASISLFKNAVRPGGVLEIDSNLDDAVYKRLKKDWDKAHKGSAQWHKMIILEGGTKWKETALKFRDAEFSLLKKMNREEICATFKVPPAIVGIFEYANYANSKEQLKMFWQHCIIPNLFKISRTLTEMYVSRNDSNMFAEFDFSDIQILKEDEEKVMKVVTGYVDRNVITINEARRDYLYLEPVKWGDEKQERVSGISANTVPEKSVKEIPHDTKTIDFSEGELSIWKKFDRDVSIDEEKLIPLISGFLEDQKNRILKNLEDFGTTWVSRIRKKFKKKIQKGQKISLSDADLDRIFDRLKEEGILGDLTKDIFLGMIAATGAAKFIELGMDFDFRPMAPSIESWLRMKIQKFVRSVNATSRKQIADIIVEALEQEFTVQDISQQIADELDRTRDYRSDRIARTEVGGTHNKGIWEALKQSGVVKTKRWIATLDERVRDTHADAHRQEVPIDDFFKVGDSLLMFPGDSVSANAEAEEVINCRCTLTAGKVET